MCAGNLEVHVAKEVLNPWISRMVSQLPSSAVISPQEIPATGALIGTPASISARVEAQTAACEVEPFEETTSDTRRMA